MFKEKVHLVLFYKAKNQHMYVYGWGLKTPYRIYMLNKQFLGGCTVWQVGS